MIFRLEHPCDKCEAPYGFKNHMTLNTNTTLFSVSSRNGLNIFFYFIIIFIKKKLEKKNSLFSITLWYHFVVLLSLLNVFKIKRGCYLFVWEKKTMSPIDSRVYKIISK